MIGKSITHYKIIEKLGAGGMGTVYKARDNKLDRFVALKFLPPHLSQDEETKKRFVHEAKAASALNHSNITIIYAIEVANDSNWNGELFIVMEYIDGKELKELIDNNQLSIDNALNYATQIAAGLQAAHEKGIVHRDIKSANIMITKNGLVKIMDFGLAKISGSALLTKVGTTLGTAAYTSPEQAQGAPTDHRTDIWAFGVVLYEMLTGELPFKGDYEPAVIYSILNEAPTNLADYRKNIPDKLNKIVEKSLKKKIDARYQNIQEILTDLQDALTTPSTTEFRHREKETPSIAVLPFVNMSADPENEYFSDGLAEDIINALTKLKNFRVAARTSAFSFKGKKTNIREIGRALNVETVLEGSVRKAGNRLRITAQLINVDDGYHIWSEQYDRVMEDVFAIQDEITHAVVHKLKVELLGNDEEIIVKKYTDNVHAYQLYLKGRYFWNQRYKGTLQQALDYFQEAIESDPNYALAYSGVADCYTSFGTWHFLPPQKAFPLAKKAAQKAIELDGNLAEGHTSLGLINMVYDWDWSSTEKALQRAIELNPNYALAHCYYGHLLVMSGRFAEAKVVAKKSLELEPLSLVVNAFAGITFYLAREYDHAIHQLQKTLEIDSNSILAHFFIAWSYSQKSMHEEAVEASQKAVDIVEGSTLWLANLGTVFGLAGKKKQAEQILKKLQRTAKKGFVSPVQFAWIYIGLGEKKEALNWLEKAYNEQAGTLNVLKVAPEYDSLRDEPRFQKILKKMNLDG